MDIVTNLEELMANANYLEKALQNKNKRALDFVKRGTCFLVYGDSENYRFMPSRFGGYLDNTFDLHESNAKKDGRDTNPAITKIIGSAPLKNEKLEYFYQQYCRQLGFEPNATGSFGVERKYWDLRS